MSGKRLLILSSLFFIKKTLFFFSDHGYEVLPGKEEDHGYLYIEDLLAFFCPADPHFASRGDPRRLFQSPVLGQFSDHKRYLKPGFKSRLRFVQ